MNRKNLPKKANIFDKIRKKVKYLFGYRDVGKFMIDTKPDMKKTTNIVQSHIANIEEILQNNKKEGQTTVEGISEKDAIKLLEWTVQNAREGLAKALKIEDMSNEDFFGMCGMGQAITAITLKNMGLSPNILNISGVAGESAGKHAFITVDIPIKLEDGTVINKTYLVDTTFRQFYLTKGFTNQHGDYIQDKKFGGRIPSIPGYWMLKQGEQGKKLSKEIISKGFFELTEENAKIYFDANYLSGVKRKKPKKVPKRSELKTGIKGSEYVERTRDKNNQEELDYNEFELNAYGVNTRTPLMYKKNINNIQGKIEERTDVNSRDNPDRTD